MPDDKDIVYICEPPMCALEFIDELNETQRLLNKTDKPKIKPYTLAYYELCFLCSLCENASTSAEITAHKQAIRQFLKSLN